MAAVFRIFNEGDPADMITMIEIIDKKRRGLVHTPEEIAELVRLTGSAKGPGDAQDCQVAAWLMAACIQGLNREETFVLTRELVASGGSASPSVEPGALGGVIVDKHSTGGVGDKTTLVLLPLLAAAGLKIAKMSGRSLGYTGGTIDKLESIPGFNVQLSREAFTSQVRRIGVAISSQTAELAPAEGRLYALRDVTATLESIPLIASSIMSKKIAAGADVIVLDVKYGRGAFMKTLEDARLLAEACIDIGERLGKRISAVLSGMEQPLGWAVGNRLEVREAVECLQGNAPADLLALCLKLGSVALVLAGAQADAAAAEALLAQKLQDGSALEKFLELVRAQGGDPAWLLEPVNPPSGQILSVHFEGEMPQAYISGVDALTVAKAALLSGAGRLTKDAPVNPDAGIRLRKKIGDAVSRGEVLAELHTNARNPAEALRMLSSAFSFSVTPVIPPPLIH